MCVFRSRGIFGLSAKNPQPVAVVPFEMARGGFSCKVAICVIAVCQQQRCGVVVGMCQWIARRVSPLAIRIEMCSPFQLPLLRCETSYPELPGPGVPVIAVLERQQIAGGVIGVF